MLIALGTLLPAIGIAFTLLAAWFTRGGRRWAVLAAVPGITLMICWLVAGTVFREGNVLAATLYILFAAVLALYYPVLATAWVVRTHRHHSRAQAAPRPMNTR